MDPEDDEDEEEEESWAVLRSNEWAYPHWGLRHFCSTRTRPPRFVVAATIVVCVSVSVRRLHFGQAEALFIWTDNRSRAPQDGQLQIS